MGGQVFKILTKIHQRILLKLLINFVKTPDSSFLIESLLSAIL
jgi:hypothetical protein